MDLIQKGKREYELLKRGVGGYSPSGEALPLVKPPDGDFDFLTSEEAQIVPIHTVEINREDRRRRGIVDRDTSKHEFAAQLGITFNDTRDPDSGRSVLEVTEAMRSYYGDPEDEAFRAYKYNLMNMKEMDYDFMKKNTFLAPNVQRQYEIARQSPSNGDTASGRQSPQNLIDAQERHYAPAHRRLLEEHRQRQQETAAAVPLAIEPRRPDNARRQMSSSAPPRNIPSSFKADMMSKYAESRALGHRF